MKKIIKRHQQLLGALFLIGGSISYVSAEDADPALLSGTNPASVSESSSGGFIEDSMLSLLSRNYYFNRDFRDALPGAQSYREEWAQGEMLEYQSGFTQGAIGFGIDAFAYAGFKLDSGKGRANPSTLSLLPIDSSGEPENAYGEMGGVIKVKGFSTEIKYGRMRTGAPVFGTGDAFLLPETATGFWLSNEAVTDLSLEAGHFTAYDNFSSSNHDDDVAPSYGGGKPGNALSYAGGTYTVSDNASVMVYGANYEDSWNQYYTNINYAVPFSDDKKLEFDFNLYRTTDTGSAYQGDISNTIFSIKPRYTNGRHTFAIAYQQVNGDTPFDYVGYDSIWVSNSSQYSDFNGPEEKSLGIGYRLDLSDMVVNGLSVGSKYTKGNGIDGTNADPLGGYAALYGPDGEHWERDIEVKYVVQSGAAKDLSFRLRQATHRANADQGEGDVDEVRVIVEYPYDFL